MAQSKAVKDSDRGLTWTHQETLALIRVWGDTEIQKEFEVCKRNTSVYVKIAKGLKECGYDRTANQCRTKIKSLRLDYFKAKNENKKSGRGRISSAFFEEIDLVLGHRPASAPPVLIDTSISDGQESETENQSFDDDSESDVPQEAQDRDEAQERDGAEATSAPQEKTAAHDVPETVNEPQRDPDLPVISLKRKRQHMKVAAKKKNKAEKLEATLEKTMTSFLEYQREAEERFEEREDKRRREEREAAEREKEKEREHELRLFSMLSGYMNSQQHNPAMMSPQQCSEPRNNGAPFHQPSRTGNMTTQHSNGYLTDMMSAHLYDEYDQSLEMSYTNL